LKLKRPLEDNIQFDHTYYQGLIIEIGNMKGLKTYVPSQDQNKNFLNRKIKEYISFYKIPNFSYKNLVGKAKYVDVL